MRKMLLFLLLLLPLSGCGRVWAETRPIRELRIIGTVGCDLSPEGTALSVCASKPTLRAREAAPTARLAMDRLCEQAASPALFFAHTQYLLAGRALAETDLAPLLDLTARSADMRIATPLFLLQNGDAADAVLAGDEERDATEMLTALQEEITQRGESHAFQCGEILLALAERGTALAAACTWDGSALRPFGYGVIVDGKCVDWIGLPESRAVDLLLALGGRGDVPLGGATVTILSSDAEIAPRWEGETLAAAEIRLSLRAELTETDGRTDGTSDAGRRALERALARQVRGWTIGLLRRSQTLGADFLDLGGMLASGDPVRFARVRDGWEARFPSLPVEVTVTAELDRTQDLQQPVPQAGGAQ